MTTPIFRKTISKDIEKHILIGLITNTKILSTFQNIPIQIFDLNICRKILPWVLSYYEKYKKAPKEQINDIFSKEKQKLSKIESEEIYEFLLSISNEFNNLLENEYLIDQIDEYIEQQLLTIISNETLNLLQEGKTNEAREKFKSYNQTKTKSHNWVAPLDDDKFIQKVFDEHTKPLITFDGALGKLIGPLHHGWILAFLGLTKIGKSWTLQEMMRQCLTKGLKVAYCVLEGQDIDFGGRIYQQLCFTPSIGKEGDDFIIPTFDCTLNQSNECQNPDRTCNIKMPDEFDPTSPYKSCIICKENNANFTPAVWYIKTKRPAITKKMVEKKIRQFHIQHGKNLLRMNMYPINKCNLSSITNDLDILKYNMKFDAKVLIIDYLDLICSNEKYRTQREEISNVWMEFKQILGERKLLGITVSQTNRQAEDAISLKGGHIAEDFGKARHSDIFIGINQTEEEKEQGTLRYQVLYHRWKKFLKRKQVMILQHLETGQPIIDMEYITYNEKEEKGKGRKKC